MSFWRFLGATLFRGVVIGGITLGLSFAFPPAMPWFVAGGVSALGLSLGASALRATRYKSYDMHTPIGDDEYHKEIPQGIFDRVEGVIIDKVEEISDSIRSKKYKKQQEKAKKLANKKDLSTEGNVKKDADIKLEETTKQEIDKENEIQK